MINPVLYNRCKWGIDYGERIIETEKELAEILGFLNKDNQTVKVEEFIELRERVGNIENLLINLCNNVNQVIIQTNQKKNRF